MITSIVYIILAAIGLGFLIFIHELGHYFMAKRVGMKVDSFGIGIGKSIYTWKRNGVDWNLGWLPFGGYVKIAGTDTDGQIDPAEVPGGYFSKGPWQRIQVALMGPLVNIVFALLLFFILYLAGGRDKNFSDYTSKIGWVDPKSELYAQGIRPGDEILSYDNYAFRGSKDHLYAPMTGSELMTVKGNKVNYLTGEKTPFEYKIKPYPHPADPDKGVMTTGILNSASYLIYSPAANTVIPESAPMANSGIQAQDRIVWVDGVQIFSLQQLNHVLNDHRALITVQRGDEFLQRRVPRVHVDDLKIDQEVRGELTDWQHAANLGSVKFTKMYVIPYNLTPKAIVEQPLKFIEKDKNVEFTSFNAEDLDGPLQEGDKIIAVDGIQVSSAYQMLAQLQQRKVNIIVERIKQEVAADRQTADEQFEKEVNWQDVAKIASTLGTNHPVKNAGDLYLLRPVTPKMRNEIVFSPENQQQLNTALLEQKKEIESIEDPEKRAQALQQLESKEKQLVLGLPAVADRKIHYNPGPIQLFTDVSEEIWRTLEALFTGHLSPKWISGPVGIVQVVHNSWMVGFKEVIFWMAAISLNLGIFNLLPIPVLDGGYICLFTYEIITKRPVKPQTIEKLIVPFFILIVGFILYITYNDLSRIFTNLFHW